MSSTIQTEVFYFNLNPLFWFATHASSGWKQSHSWFPKALSSDCCDSVNLALCFLLLVHLPHLWQCFKSPLYLLSCSINIWMNQLRMYVTIILKWKLRFILLGYWRQFLNAILDSAKVPWTFENLFNLLKMHKRYL